MKRLVTGFLFIVILVVTGPASVLRAQEPFSSAALREENAALRRMVDSLKRVIAKIGDYVDPWDNITGIEDSPESLGYGMSSLDGPVFSATSPTWLREADPEMGLEYRDDIANRLNGYRSRASSLSWAIGRYRYYEPSFEKVFSRYGVPSEFMALAIVESAVSRTAVSHAGAAGMWQLMPATARQYGLRVDDLVDERFDVAKSTDVAARVLRDLRRSMGNWGLAVMAYNCGSANVRKAVIRSGGSTEPWDAWEYVPNETKSYLPSLVAVRYFLLNSDKEGLPYRSYRPETGKTVKVDKDIDFAVVALVLGADIEALCRLNPQYVSKIVPAGLPFSLPVKIADSFTAAVNDGRI